MTALVRDVVGELRPHHRARDAPADARGDHAPADDSLASLRQAIHGQPQPTLPPYAAAGRRRAKIIHPAGRACTTEKPPLGSPEARVFRHPKGTVGRPRLYPPLTHWSPKGHHCGQRVCHPLKPQELPQERIGELSGNLHARRGDLLGEHALDVRGLLFGRHRECGARTFDAAPSLLSELRGGLPEERVAVLERHHDAPKGVVVAQTGRFAESMEPIAPLLRRGPSHHPRECLVDVHDKTSASTLRTSPAPSSMLRAPYRWAAIGRHSTRQTRQAWTCRTPPNGTFALRLSR